MSSWRCRVWKFENSWEQSKQVLAIWDLFPACKQSRNCLELQIHRSTFLRHRMLEREMSSKSAVNCFCVVPTHHDKLFPNESCSSLEVTGRSRIRVTVDHVFLVNWDSHFQDGVCYLARVSNWTATVKSAAINTWIPRDIMNSCMSEIIKFFIVLPGASKKRGAAHSVVARLAGYLVLYQWTTLARAESNPKAQGTEENMLLFLRLSWFLTMT